MLALFLCALPAVTATAETPRPDSGTAAGPFASVPGLRPQVDFWIEVFTQLRQNEVLLHDARYPLLRYDRFALPGTVEEGLSKEPYRVRAGDTLGSIARRQGVPCPRCAA